MTCEYQYHIFPPIYGTTCLMQKTDAKAAIIPPMYPIFDTDNPDATAPPITAPQPMPTLKTDENIDIAIVAA